MSIDSNNARNIGKIQENSSLVKNLHKFDDTLLASPEFIANPIRFLNDYRNKGVREVLRIMINKVFCPQLQQAWIGKEILAHKIGYSERHTDRLVDKAIDHGLMSKKVGGYNEANVYRLNPIFDHPVYRFKLSKIFPILKTSFLLSINLLAPNVTGRNVPAITEGDVFNSISITKQERLSVLRETSMIMNSLWYSHDARTRARDEMGGECYANQNHKKIQSVNTIKKSESMVNEQVRKSMEFIDAGLKSMIPTKWGKYNLAVYPVEALQYADECMMQSTETIHDAFKFFAGCAWKYCVNKNLTDQIDWKPLNALRASTPDIDLLPLVEKVLRDPNNGTRAQAKGLRSTKTSSNPQPTFRLAKPGDSDYNNPRTPRDPRTFNYEGEHAKKISAAKELVSQGKKLNPFMHDFLMVHDPDYASSHLATRMPSVSDQAIVGQESTPADSSHVHQDGVLQPDRGHVQKSVFSLMGALQVIDAYRAERLSTLTALLAKSDSDPTRMTAEPQSLGALASSFTRLDSGGSTQ